MRGRDMNKYVLILIVVISLSMLGAAFIDNEPYTSEVKTGILYTTPISQTVLFTVEGNGIVEIWKNGYNVLNVGNGYSNTSQVFKYKDGSIITNFSHDGNCRWESDGYCFNNHSIKRYNNLTTTYYDNDTYKFVSHGDNGYESIISGTKEELVSLYGNHLIIKFEE